MTQLAKVTFGQDTIIVGRGANEQKAWALAREISARRKNWHNVYHLFRGKWHMVTCYEGRQRGHLYDAGGFWWSATTTIAERGQKLRSTLSA